MPFVHSENRSVRHLRVVSRRGGPRERVCDCWPDFASALTMEEGQDAAARNRPGRILLQALGAIVYSIGLVVCLMILVQLAQRGW